MNYCEEINPGVYKVRSIADLFWNGNKYILIGNDYTCFLSIANWMKSYDSKDWERHCLKNKSFKRNPNNKLETRIIHEKRGRRRKLYTLNELINKGKWITYIDYHNEEIKSYLLVCRMLLFFEKSFKMLWLWKTCIKSFWFWERRIHISYPLCNYWWKFIRRGI